MKLWDKEYNKNSDYNRSKEGKIFFSLKGFAN